MTPIRQTFFLDTNVYIRRLVRERITLPTSIQRRIALSYITYHELVAKLQKSRSNRTFVEVREMLVLARKHSRRRFLSHPTEFVQHKLFNYPLNRNNMADTKKGLALAVRIKNWENLTGPIRMYGSFHYHLNDFTRLQREIQKDWVSAINVVCGQFTGPNKLPPAPLTGNHAALVNSFVVSKQWRRIYATAIINKLDPNSDQEELMRVADGLDAAAVYTGSILQLVLVSGYKFEQKANDSFDHLQLQYLCDENMVFITDDRPLRDRVRHSSQFCRIISLDEAFSHSCSGA